MRARLPGSSSAMPNFEVRVAVLIAAMVPTPTCGLMRMPITAAEPPCSRIAASTRSSSWKLSMLRVMPCRKARAISPRVLAGESNTISSGGKPAPSAWASSPGLATSQAMPSWRSGRRMPSRHPALAAKAWVK